MENRDWRRLEGGPRRLKNPTNTCGFEAEGARRPRPHGCSRRDLSPGVGSAAGRPMRALSLRGRVARLVHAHHCAWRRRGCRRVPVGVQYVTAEWEPAFLRQAREFLFFSMMSPILGRNSDKHGKTGTKLVNRYQSTPLSLCKAQTQLPRL